MLYDQKIIWLQCTQKCETTGVQSVYRDGCNLEYASQAWSPHNRNNIKALESVQCGMTIYIVGNNYMFYQARCQQLNILPLSYHREIMDLTYLNKYFYGAICVDFTSGIKAIHVNSSLRFFDQGFKLNESL